MSGGRMGTRARYHLGEDCSGPGGRSLVDLKVLHAVMRSTNWNPFLLCSCACICKQSADYVKRFLWKEFCLSRAPKMATDLLSGMKHGAIDGGWDTLGKLLFFCAGSHRSQYFEANEVPPHFAWKTRFSRTSGKSFVMPQNRADVLYISDPCEHLDVGGDDVGLFRGIFRSFRVSRTRKMLIERGAQLEQNRVCPFCKAKMWSMAKAKMIPPSAQRRLASYESEDSIEYFVCLNGHLHGMCLLLPLSDCEKDSGEE